MQFPIGSKIASENGALYSVFERPNRLGVELRSFEAFVCSAPMIGSAARSTTGELCLGPVGMDGMGKVWK